MKPKGIVLIIGGAEDKGTSTEGPGAKNKNKNFKHFDILAELLPRSRRSEHSIAVITTASEIPGEMSRDYKAAFEKIGFTGIHHINIKTKGDARSEKNIRQIEKAHAIFFSGGDQLRLGTIIGGTDVAKAITKKYIEKKGFIVAGTSSGAMVMPKLMIISGESSDSLVKGEVRIASGLGLIDCCIVDTHFMKKARFGRLAQAVLMNPTCTGIGLCEDTALIIRKGSVAECRGSGMVYVIDGSKIKHTNFAYADFETPVNVENLKVHILAEGDGYNIGDGSFITSKKDKRYEKSIQ